MVFSRSCHPPKPRSTGTPFVIPLLRTATPTYGSAARLCDVANSGLFRINHGESFETGNLAEDFVCSDKVIDQALGLQRQRNSDLNRVESPQAYIESVLFNQALSAGKF